MSSGGLAIVEEPNRYTDYLLRDGQALRNVYDWTSFVEAVKTIYAKDSSLINLVSNLDSDEEMRPMFESTEIQAIIKENQSNTMRQIEREVMARATRPISGAEVRRRAEQIYERRLGTAPERIKKLKVKRGKPVRYREIPVRDGSGQVMYYKTPSRAWIDAEIRFLAKRFDKLPKEVIAEYHLSPLAHRSTISIRRKFYRLRRDFENWIPQTKAEFIAKYR